MHTSPVNIWQFVASTLVGQGAFGSLGQLRNWILGATVWGVVVDAAMNLLLAVKIGAPFVPGFTQGLLGHIVFYASPMTWHVSRNALRQAQD